MNKVEWNWYAVLAMVVLAWTLGFVAYTAADDYPTTVVVNVPAGMEVRLVKEGTPKHCLTVKGVKMTMPVTEITQVPEECEPKLVVSPSVRPEYCSQYD